MVFPAPACRKPLDKLFAQGPRILTDAELLSLVLGPGERGVGPVTYAQRLLSDRGGLRPLLAAGPDKGLRRAQYARLQAALEMTRRHYREALDAGPLLDAPARTTEFLIAQLRDRPYEVFCCLHLDSRHRLIGFDELFRGTIDGASVHPREVVRQAMERNAAAVIFAHNHPSGVAEASQADELITRRLREALALMDIRVLDHLIVGDGACLSFAERGLL